MNGDAEPTLRVPSRRRLAGSINIVHDCAEALEFIFCTDAYPGRDPHHPRANWAPVATW